MCELGLIIESKYRGKGKNQYEPFVFNVLDCLAIPFVQTFVQVFISDGGVWIGCREGRRHSDRRHR